MNKGSVKPCNSLIIDNSLYKKSKTFIVSSKSIKSGDCAALIEQLQHSSISVAISTQ